MEDARTLGADLRSLRKSRGLTLEDVSDRLGKSVGWLSQVERDISQPDTTDLASFSKVFGVPLSLVSVPEGPEAEEGRVVRKTHRRKIGERVPGLDETLLSPDLTDDFEVIHSVFNPGSNIATPVMRETSEVGVIVSGKLDIWLNGEAFTVSQGDSFRVRGETLRWSNPYDQPAVAVWVISPPVY